MSLLGDFKIVHVEILPSLRGNVNQPKNFFTIMLGVEDP